jgi:hypothetical protein
MPVVEGWNRLPQIEAAEAFGIVAKIDKFTRSRVLDKVQAWHLHTQI